MKILKTNDGPLTNLEVYDFLVKRGASKDYAQRVMMSKLRELELKVFDYLVETTAVNQMRESINEFMEKSKVFDLAKAEVVNIVNIRPIDLVEVAPCVEESETRMDDERLQELQEMIDSVLPSHPFPERFGETAANDDYAQASDEEAQEDKVDAS